MQLHAREREKKKKNMDEILHFSHDHPLQLKEDQDIDGKQAICSGCEEPISGPSYHCTQANCNFILHKSCTDLPHQIKHPQHPQHPLTLLRKSPYRSLRYFCNICSKSFSNFDYHCSLCQYDLDISCAALWRVVEDGHIHSFISLRRKVDFACYACGVEANDFPLLCVICQIWVHPDCGQLPQIQKIRSHHHPLNLSYSLHQAHGFKEISCNVCNQNLSTTFAGYSCPECSYNVHLKCAKELKDDDSEVVEPEKPGEALGDDSYKVIKRVEDGKVTDIQHFSHHHALKLVENLTLEDSDKDKLCDCCIQPVSVPFFTCPRNCGFFLHQSCAELARRKQHRFHQHPLILHKKVPGYDGIYRCDGCKLYSNGFVYRCQECQFDLDVRCGSMPETIAHDSHQHTLILKKTNVSRLCRGCNIRSKHVFVCGVCEWFAIDARCATLQSTAWHESDKHPLRLINGAEDNLVDCIHCGICKEKSRTLKEWFYYCDDCDFYGHPYCVLGNSKYVKFGCSFKYDSHLHPLTLVEGSRQSHSTPCAACHELWVGWALDCGQCKFWIHREGNCFWEQFKKSKTNLALSGLMRERFAANVLAAIPNVTAKQRDV